MKWIWFTEHKGWLAGLASTFIGSLFSITLTFGVSSHGQNKQQKEMSRKLLITTMCDIEEKCRQIDKICEKLSYTDSVFASMLLFYHMSAKNPNLKFPKEKVEAYYRLKNDESLRQVVGYTYLDEMEDRKDQKSFSSNAEVIRIFNDLSMVDAIKKIDELTGDCRRMLDLMNELKIKILGYDEKYKVGDHIDLYENFIKYQFKYEKEERLKRLTAYSGCNLMLQEINKKLKRDIPIIRKKLNLTEDDMNSAKTTIIDDENGFLDVAIDDSVTDSIFDCYYTGLSKALISSSQTKK